MRGMLTAIGTLLVVVLIIYLSFVVTKLIAKTNLGRGSSRYMRVCDQIVIGQDRSVIVLQVGDRFFLVGMSSGQITLLDELDEEGLLPLEPGESMSGKNVDFKDVIGRLSEKMRRK